VDIRSVSAGTVPARVSLHVERFPKSKISTETDDFLNQLLAFIAFRNPWREPIAECDPFDKRESAGSERRVARRRNDA
jgi:hypothetical protein